MPIAVSGGRAGAAGPRCPAAAGYWRRPPPARAAPRSAARVAIQQRAGHQPAEDPQPVRLPRAQPGLLDQRDQRGQGEPPRVSPTRGSASIARASAKRPARARCRTAATALEASTLTVAARPEHAGDRAHRVGRLLDVFEHIVADDQVSRVRADHAAQAGRVALYRGQPRSRLGRAPLRGRERVRARVDDRHVVPEGRERHGQPASAPAHVHDVQGRAAGGGYPGGDDGAQHIPDQGGADAVAPEVRGHASLLFPDSNVVACRPRRA